MRSRMVERKSYVVPGVPTGLGFGVGVGWEGEVEDSAWRPYWQPPNAKRRRSAAIFISVRHDLLRRLQGFGGRPLALGIRRGHTLLPDGTLGLRPMLISLALGPPFFLVELIGERRDMFLFGH